MRLFVAFSLVAVTLARPEAGYSYNVPNRGLINGFNSGLVAGGGLRFGGGGHGLTTGIGGNLLSAGSGSGFSESIGGFGPGVGGFGPVGPPTIRQSFEGSGVIQPGLQQQIIQKHVYVHVPPPEPEELRQQSSLSLGIPQKHYKIIFIKAPSPPQPSQAQIALAEQSQEKTIVYVLVKKPDDVSDFALSNIAPIPPSKPEVYFIKYRTHRGGPTPLPILPASPSIPAGPEIGLNSIGSASVDTGLSVNNGLDNGLLIDGYASGQPISNVVQGTPATNYGPPGHSGPY